jgi:hypothetical protein
MSTQPDSTTATFSALTFEAWEKRFKPTANRITPNASFDGLMFETYGADLMEVLRIANGYAGKAGSRKVWTLCEGDEGEPVIVEGYHLCNRLGYFLTEKPAKAGVQYNVSL